jgi:hypothetical protein
MRPLPIDQATCTAPIATRTGQPCFSAANRDRQRTIIDPQVVNLVVLTVVPAVRSGHQKYGLGQRTGGPPTPRRAAGRQGLEAEGCRRLPRCLAPGRRRLGRRPPQGRRRGAQGQPHSGARPKLFPLRERSVLSWLTRSPRAFSYKDDLWTCRRLAEVIARKYGVRFNASCLTEKQPAASHRDLSRVDRWVSLPSGFSPVVVLSDHRLNLRARHAILRGLRSALPQAYLPGRWGPAEAALWKLGVAGWEGKALPENINR